MAEKSGQGGSLHWWEHVVVLTHFTENQATENRAGIRVEL